MLYKLDLWILERVEKFSHWWQRTFGQDCFWWAKVCLFFISIIPAISFSSIAGVFMSCLCFTGVGIRICIAEILVKEILYGKGVGNSLKIDKEEFETRISGIFALVLGLPMVAYGNIQLSFISLKSVLLLFLFFIFLSASTYFIACDPLPPAKSKVRKWLESLTSTIKEFFTPTPEPVPVRIPSH